MIFRVQTHLAAILVDQRRIVREELDPVTAQEEGGFGIPLLQTFQKILGKLSGGTVIKGQGHILDLDAFTADGTGLCLAVGGFTQGMGTFAAAGCVAAFTAFTFCTGSRLPVVAQRFSAGGNAVAADGGQGTGGIGVAVFDGFPPGLTAFFTGLRRHAGGLYPHMIAPGEYDRSNDQNQKDRCQNEYLLFRGKPPLFDKPVLFIITG